MVNKLHKSRRFTSTWLGVLIVILLMLGIVFRFVNLDQKIYWIDETFTSLRISGYRLSEMIPEISKGDAIAIKELHKYQQTNPEKNLIGTIKGLAFEEPQHPPLYYVMARFWGQLFGNSVAVRRSFSALISLLMFPAIYWLCQELFESSLVGWVAMALVAVSPFQVLYAQAARQYGLWSVTILLSSAALLRAIRLTKPRNTTSKIRDILHFISTWGIYALTLVTGFYTFLFSILVAISHGIYVLVTERFRFSKRLVYYGLSSLMALMVFVPWLLVSNSNLSKVSSKTKWALKEVPLSSLAQTWLININRSFFDLNQGLNLPSVLVSVIILILVGYAIYFLCRHSPKRVSLFILTLIGVTALALVLPDLISGGKRSSVTRYLIPCYLGIQLAVAYLFTNKITNKITSIFQGVWQQKLWRLGMILLLSGGILSCVISSQAEFWWNKYTSANHTQVAAIINQAEQPLLLTKSLEVISLSYLLDPKVKFSWLSHKSVKMPNGEKSKQLIIPENTDEFSDVFLYNPSKELREKIEKQYNYKSELIGKWNHQLEPTYEIKAFLWKLVKE
ncbi:MAG: hypothetical protein F6K56_13700 [Moorea sp. SIO3G5]|nr:hypothetical protein [Moorena sp. SIO3G5]